MRLLYNLIFMHKEKTMALRTIRIAGDPVLTKKCREITEMTPRIR